MFSVALIPGFTASDLAIIATGQRIWFDQRIAALTGLGAMRLAPNGIDPGQPDGAAMGHSADPQFPWETIKDNLTQQLDPKKWKVGIGTWDWRLDINTAANTLAADIKANVSFEEPITLVAHSAGGLLAVLCYAKLMTTNDQMKVRRIVTIGTPFLGSYGPIQWLTGISDTVQQLLAVSQAFGQVTGFHPALWTLQFLNGIACTWPAFYELFPALVTEEERFDPFRTFLYESQLYPHYADPSQSWLDFARTSWQPQITALGNSPPSWVLTCVAGVGLTTPNRLLTGELPLALRDLGTTQEGDGVVTYLSAAKLPSLIVRVPGEHASLPLGITISGLLAELIVDPRGPGSPTPTPEFNKLLISMNVTAPPESEPFSGLVCIGGG